MKTFSIVQHLTITASEAALAHPEYHATLVELLDLTNTDIMTQWNTAAAGPPPVALRATYRGGLAFGGITVTINAMTTEADA